MNRTLKSVFLVSLLANVLLVGIVLGDLPYRFGHGPGRQERTEKVLKELPEPVQARFRERMERLQKDDEPRRTQIQAARMEAIRILTAEPFDEAAYDREVSRIDELRTQRSLGMATIVKEVARDLPRPQRQVLAELLNRPPPPGAGRR